MRIGRSTAANGASPIEVLSIPDPEIVNAGDRAGNRSTAKINTMPIIPALKGRRA